MTYVRLAAPLLAAALAAGCNCGPSCKPGGTANIAVVYSGLPDGVTGTTTFTGASSQTVTGSTTLSAVGSGDWTGTGQNATRADPRVRSVYGATLNPPTFCVAAGATQNVAVDWAQIPTSNTLWVTTANSSSQLVGFRSAQLADTGTRTADVGAQVGAGGDLAFDKDGNLWSFGATTADSMLVRFGAGELASSGTLSPDRKIDIGGLSCLPAVAGMAFDKSGNLWVSSGCKNLVYRVDAGALLVSATVTPTVTVAVSAPRGLAFDKSGNLWVASETANRLLRFDAASLTGTSAAPAAQLGVRQSAAPGNTSLFTPSWVAFDASGDLWSNDFGGNVIFRVAKADLAQTGQQDVQPGVRIFLSVSALLNGLAFDEGGGLWTAYSQGKLARLSPAQLTVSSTQGQPTAPDVVVTSADVSSVGNVALYPAPAALPLYDALP